MVTPCAAQAIWFAPLSGPQGPKDFWQLFQPNAPWRKAASHVQAFEIAYDLVDDAPEADLRTMFADLRRRHIALVVGVAALSGPGSGDCGFHVEGYGAHGTPYLLAQKLKALGAEPAYFAMDEPLYYGHVFGPQGGKGGCHSPIPALAKDVADSVRQIRTFFPGVPIGDVEPLSFNPRDHWFKDGVWLHDISEWLDGFQAVARERLAFFRLDLRWTAPWQQHMPALTQLLQRKGVPLQVIYDGDDQDKTDAAWIAHAVAHFRAFESGLWPRPAAASIQFWGSHPSHILPETDTLTATGLVDQYVDWQQTRGKR